MHFLLSLVLISSFFVLIIAGLISVLRDMLLRGGSEARSLNLDLPGDLNHPLRRQVEPVHDLRGIAIQEGE
jgi:hypothetical protein